MPVDLWTIAGHEAAHAVMRYLCGMPATEITASPEGGLCAGTGKRVLAADQLWVLLAGIAWETGCGLFGARVVWSQMGGFPDVDEAREILATRPFLWPMVEGKEGWQVGDPETALQHHFERVCERLLPYALEIEELGARLMDSSGRLSARQVAGWLRAHVGRARVFGVDAENPSSAPR